MPSHETVTQEPDAYSEHEAFEKWWAAQEHFGASRLTAWNGWIARAERTLRSARADTKRLDALERLYRSVLVEDRGHGRVTYRLDQEAAGEALPEIAATDGSHHE